MIDLNRIIGIDDNQKDSKVVLASRYDDVCHDMEVDEIVDVERLSLTDSWNMFEEKSCKNFQKEGENVSRWEDGLKRLQRWDSIKIEGMDEVLERLEICYEDLKMMNRRFAFMYPEESEIYVDYLLECWRAEGFINHANDFKQARNRGHTVLNELIKVSLLERSDKSKCVKMNKVLENGPQNIITNSRKEEWEHANRISLMDNQLSTLPGTLDCRNLLTLLLQRNKYLTSIPELFFKSMCCLQIAFIFIQLDLPQSVFEFLLDLIEIPSSVEALKHLEVLDIRKTKLNLLQIALQGKSCMVTFITSHHKHRVLIWLKCLRISLCNFDTGNHTEAQVSGFDSLEELSVDVGSSKEGWDKIVDTVVKEDSFLTFHFAIGCHDSTCAQILESIDNPSYNILKLVNCDGIDPVIIKVLMKTNAFRLIGHKGVTSLSNFGIEKMNRMFHCLIDGCHEIKTIVYGNETSKAVLEWLENLYINNVPKLESIWQGPVHVGRLAQLTSVTLSKCPELKKIFSHGMIQQLLQLKHLRVQECHQIEEIIMESENTQLEGQALPKLKTLILTDLPRLGSIWANVEISMCYMLKNLPFNKVNATKLRSIQGQQSWWGALVWKDDATKQRLQPLCILN
ncbi:hypothetical protein AAG906_007653 [Vitis piasezkii]